MSLFGGGSKTSTSKVTRPGYVTSMVNDLSNQINSAATPEWINQNYAGLTSDQQSALNQLLNNSQLTNYANQLMGAGQSGLSQLTDVQNQLANLYGKGQISAADINNLAGQLYNSEDVENAIKASNAQTEQQLATATNPAVAQQTMQQAGFGSSQRLAKDQAARAALSEEQGNANSITNQAYNSALEQAQGILSGNRQNQLNALSGLGQIGSQQAGLLNTAANAYQQNYLNQLNAANQQWQNEQGALDTKYNNAIGAQNMGWQDINNRLNAAGVLNGALGQTQKTTVSGGGGGLLGGLASGAAAGSAFGPWGALAGAALGGVMSASQ
jgi:hypothetical protein